VEYPFGTFGIKADCSTLEIEANILDFNGLNYETLHTFNSSYFRHNTAINTCQLIMNKTLEAFNETTYSDLHSIEN
jgi:hypothetical protein